MKFQFEYKSEEPRCKILFLMMLTEKLRSQIFPQTTEEEKEDKQVEDKAGRHFLFLYNM